MHTFATTPAIKSFVLAWGILRFMNNLNEQIQLVSLHFVVGVNADGL